MRPTQTNPNRAAGTSTDSLAPSNAVKGATNTIITDEFEAATVVDVILDETHPEIKRNTVDIPRTPTKSDGTAHQAGDPDLSYIGRILIRPINTYRASDRGVLKWAIPLDSSMTEYPLINELVSVVFYLGQWYYTTQINLKNRVNSNADFSVELDVGDGFVGVIRDPKNTEIKYKGPKSNVGPSQNNLRVNGVMGRYIKFNKNIRKLKRYEGDSIIEGRFGNSIRMGAYDSIRTNDKGDPIYVDYSDQGGNPAILIRNRQRPIAKIPTDVTGKPNNQYDVDGNPSGVRLEFERDFNSYIHESVNWDGTSIHITSGLTKSKWSAAFHFKKKHFQSDGATEEQPAYSPSGASKFRYPILDKDQVVFQSDRIIISARSRELFMYAKKRLQLLTDKEFCVDSHEQMVFTTNEKFVVNSPHIYLGEYDQTHEPALLGQTTIDWLYDLCEWMKSHTHWYKHSHPGAGGASPDTTQMPVEVQKLVALQKRLVKLPSKRVFITGGGQAPGADGKSIKGLDNSRVGKISNTPGGYHVKVG